MRLQPSWAPRPPPAHDRAPVRHLDIVGLGLLGSSVARGVKARGIARKLTGYDLSPEVRARAAELGFCDEIAATPEAAVVGVELVLVAVPVGATAEAVATLAPHQAKGRIVTEVGWVKAAVIPLGRAETPRGRGLCSWPLHRWQRAFRPRRRLR